MDVTRLRKPFLYHDLQGGSTSYTNVIPSTQRDNAARRKELPQKVRRPYPDAQFCIKSFYKFFEDFWCSYLGENVCRGGGDP
jgi:hypothetical protein